MGLLKPLLWMINGILQITLLYYNPRHPDMLTQCLCPAKMVRVGIQEYAKQDRLDPNAIFKPITYSNNDLAQLTSVTKS